MPLTVTGTVTSPRAFGEWLKKTSRRQVAAQLRKQGESALRIGLELANDRLGPDRVGVRRRNKGVSYRHGFEVVYSGLEDFANGYMRVSVRNRAKHARLIEHGSSEHEITPSAENTKQLLTWPAPPYNVAGPIYRWTAHVNHPGTKPYKILEDTARRAIIQGLGGRTLGHIRIVMREGRVR